MRGIIRPLHTARRTLLLVAAIAAAVAGGVLAVRLTRPDHYTRAEYVADCTRSASAARSCGCEYDALLKLDGRRQVDAMEHATAAERRAAPAVAAVC